MKSTLNCIWLRAECQLAPSATLFFGYKFERLNCKDYRTQVGAAQFSNTLFSGDRNSEDSVYELFGRLRMRF